MVCSHVHKAEVHSRTQGVPGRKEGAGSREGRDAGGRDENRLECDGNTKMKNSALKCVNSPDSGRKRTGNPLN